MLAFSTLFLGCEQCSSDFIWYKNNHTKYGPLLISGHLVGYGTECLLSKHIIPHPLNFTCTTSLSKLEATSLHQLKECTALTPAIGLSCIRSFKGDVFHF